MSKYDRKVHRKEIRSRIKKLRDLYRVNGWTVLESVARVYEAALNIAPDKLGWFVPGFDVHAESGKVVLTFFTVDGQDVVFKVETRTNPNRFDDRVPATKDVESFISAYITDVVERKIAILGVAAGITTTALFGVIFCQVMQVNEDSDDCTFHVVDVEGTDQSVRVCYQSEDGLEEMELTLFSEGMVKDILRVSVKGARK